jgi:CO/xanthine dehydrogenase Mo-binding subunit
MNATISHPIRRVDADDKSRASAQYIADLDFAGQLYARTLRADRPRARILSIDLPPLPDSYHVVDRRDAPASNRVHVLLEDWPFFAEDVVNHIGEPILLLVGPDRETLDGLLARIVVHYEDLEAIFTLEEAEDGRKPPIFGADNCFAAYAIEKGDPDGAFARAARVVEGEYHTGLQEHVYMEPQGLVATVEDGKVTIFGSMQCPYYIKKALIQALGCDPAQVRVVQTTTGGAFGGKEEYPSLLAGHVAFAALKTGRPVRLIFDRAEDIQASTKRHPSRFRYRTALDENGRILGMDVDVTLDGGAYAGLSSVVLQRAMFAAAGVYHVENLRVRGRALATNTVPTGAFRGFGAPQAFFAIEMHMTQIAAELGLDPLDFKMAHAYRKGDRTATSGLMRQDIKLPEIVARLDEMSGYRRKRIEFEGERGRVRRGIGVALFLHGCGFTGDGEQAIIKARAKLVKRTDGRVEILVANVEMGQGAATALRKIVAHALSLPMERVVFENPDTDRVPDSGPTVASRTVMIVGGLLARAAQELEKRWDEGEEVEVTKAYEHPAGVEWDQKTLKGDAYPSYGWGANAVEVEVDPLTWEVSVRGAWGVYDVGVPIDEQIVRGQIEGGLAQGLGYATIEVMDLRQGRILQSSLTDYTIPTSLDIPEISSDFVLNPYEAGPFGAKGAGEMPLVGAAPALAAAVQHALGIPISSIPVTPEHLLQEIRRHHVDTFSG